MTRTTVRGSKGWLVLAAGLTIALVVWILGRLTAEERDRDAAAVAPTPASLPADPGTAALLSTDARRAPAAAEPGLPEAAPAPSADTTPTAAAAPLTGRIFGRVLGRDGQPAVGRRLRLLRTTAGTSLYATTDAAGSYDQRGLEAGRYHVSTDPSEEELAALGLASKFGGLEWRAQASVVLAPGEERELDLGAPPERPIRVHGRLRGAEPGEAALLQWAPEDEHGYDLARYPACREDGTYEVVLASPGTYHVSVMSGRDSVRVDSAVTVPDVAEFECDLELPTGEVLVTVLDEEGATVSGATVELSPRAGAPPVAAMSATTFWKRTRGDGRATFQRVRAGEWSVAAHSAARADTTPLAAARQTLRVAEGAGPTELTLRLAPGVQPVGRVLDAAGAPVVGATVIVFEASGEPLTPLNGARSGKDGGFTLTGLARAEVGAREYAVVAGRADRWSEVVRFSVPAEGAPPPLELRLGPAGRLVVRAPGIPAPEGVDVRHDLGWQVGGLVDRAIFDSHSSRRASTCEWRYDLPPGNYTVRAMTASGPRVTRVAAVVAGEEVRVDLR